MSSQLDLEAIRSNLASDLATFKAQKERLNKLRSLAPTEVNPADRMMIINWSRPSIREYSKQIEALEEKDHPSKEERQAMQALNELIIVGDQLGEMLETFRAELEAKLGSVDLSPEAPPTDAVRNKNGRSGMPSEDREPVEELKPTQRRAPTEKGASVECPQDQPAAGLNAQARAATVERDSAPSAPPARIASPSTSGLARQKRNGDVPTTNGCAPASQPSDPKGVYAILGIDPDASPKEVKKAIVRKKLALHPDRNTHPEAATRYADFNSLCEETVGTEEKRKAYDSNATSEHIENLTRRVRELTTGPTA